MASLVETAIHTVVAKGVTALASFNRSRLPALKGPNPFLTGLHAPMAEELTIEDLAVTGTIPPALDGRYLRIGPNPIAPDPKTYQWFLGDGMVHGVRIEGGRARWYRNRWVRSAAVTTALNEPRAAGVRHGDFDTVNTNVVGIAGQIRALVEAGSTPVVLDDTLGTLAYDDFGGTLRGSFSAHPHLDPLTGEMHAIAYAPQDPTVIHHVVVGADGRVRREEPVRVSHGPMIHDCAITARFVVILDLPVTFSMAALIGGSMFPFRWNPAHPARVGLLRRDGPGDVVIWCDVDPCFVFHVANAYDTDDGGVILDVVAYDRMFAETTLGPEAPRGAFERWVIDPVAHSVHRNVIDRHQQDFPRIDERRCGRPYRYAYTMMLPEIADPAFLGTDCLLKHDLQTGACTVHGFGPQRYPGEFVFVPAHPDAAEGEGWLIGFVINALDDTTDLVILDAEDFTGPPAASIHIPHQVPSGFHGNWVPNGPR
ncbi:MAG TPA: carotenoid oxygenase family protein [Stellaceae bacterium]|jgi:carotenoid cleavage dioxygenase|nr:carotenoid oxygenase family protein [Stellaceae bacterium]